MRKKESRGLFLKIERKILSSPQRVGGSSVGSKRSSVPKDEFVPSDIFSLKGINDFLFRKSVTKPAKVWVRDLEGIVFGLHRGSLIVGGQSWNIRALNPSTGKDLWVSSEKGFVYQGKDVLYAWGRGQGIVAIDPQNGIKLWSEGFEERVGISLIDKKNRMWLRGEKNIILYDLNQKNVSATFPLMGDFAIDEDRSRVYFISSKWYCLCNIQEKQANFMESIFGWGS